MIIKKQINITFQKQDIPYLRMLLAAGQRLKPIGNDPMIKINGGLATDYKEFQARNVKLLNELRWKEESDESK